MDCFYEVVSEDDVQITLLTKSKFDELAKSSLDHTINWILTSSRSVKAGQHFLVPDEAGKVSQVVVIVDDNLSIWTLAGLPMSLPSGQYYLTDDVPADARQKLSIGWGLGAYQFTRFTSKKECAQLLMAKDIDQALIDATINASYLVRDLINQPANEMMPQHLADAAKHLADQHGASFEVITGDELLENNYPLIHAVGRASIHAPRLIKLTWGEENHPLLCIAGKGVCFDSGGLNIKNASGMRWMKKDMGGAAHALGLASYIMQTKLPVRMQVAIPAVENAISSDAYRPGDVIVSRSGQSVEIDNTDAEGRLVLADAMHELNEMNPDLLIDFATLTGAARVALGTEVGVFFSQNDKTSHGLYAAANNIEDDIW